MKKLLLTRIAKAIAIDDFLKLLQESSEEKLQSRLTEIFSRQSLPVKDPVYAEILQMITRAYSPARTLPPHQQISLAETLYQKSQNLVNLADYKARGTRKVQVRAILDSRTTPQCTQMHGRIFELPALSQAASNQVPLVHNEAYWQNANYFRGIPTSETIPALPPYHYNCRTRIVPYIFDAQYDSFDSLPPNSPIYPQILSDRLANYDLNPAHLPGIHGLASLAKWKPGSRELHFEKHKNEFTPVFITGRQYAEAGASLLTDPDCTTSLRIEGDQLILYLIKPIPSSKSGASLVAVFDLTKKHFKSFYKKSLKSVNRILALDGDYKTMIFKPIVEASSRRF